MIIMTATPPDFRPNILIVEDEVNLANFVKLELEYEGYAVTVAHDGVSGIMMAREEMPELIILDWMIPGLSGVEVCRRLRTTGCQVPIIFMTAKDDVTDRVEGLDAGADDYVVKPFSIEELLARVRAHLRRNQPSEAEQLQYSDVFLNRNTREVWRGKRQIELTAKEFELLDYLLRHPRQVVTRDRILEEVWGYDFAGDSNIIEVYIRYLRIKLEADDEPRVIQTVRGVGYLLKETE